MATSTLIKKLSMVTTGVVFIALEITGVAQVFAINDMGWDEPSDLETLVRLAFEPSPAQAATLTLGGPWYEFSFTQTGLPAKGCFPADPKAPRCVPSSNGNSMFVGSPAWEFIVPQQGAILTVTDAFLRASVFDIFNFGTLIGSTSPASMEGTCGSNPEVCFADPFASRGVFNLAAGFYSLTIAPKVGSPVGAGAAYFRIDEAKKTPEPASGLSLLVLSALGVGSMLKHKQQSK
jgi:hypothetical protein